MDKIVGLLVIVFIVAVSGQEYVLTAKQEVQYEVHDQMPSSDELASMIHKLATRLHTLSAADQAGTNSAPPFSCLFCTEILTLLYNSTTDPALLVFIQNFMRQYACTYWVPSGYKTYCEDYVDYIPALIKAFANDYLNPNRCARFCNSPEVNQPLNILNSIMRRAYLTDGSK